jgi:hypothetical protein
MSSQRERNHNHWTTEQIHELDKFVEHRGRHWQMVSAHFNRQFTPRQCRNKWEATHPYAKDWTEKDEDDLLEFYNKFATAQRIPWRKFRHDITGGEAKNKFLMLRQERRHDELFTIEEAEEFHELLTQT